jgi:DNA-binding CsgD family transcriptional regulator
MVGEAVRGAALSKNSWKDVTDAVCAFLPGSFSALLYQNIENNDHHAYALSNLEMKDFENYTNYYCLINPWIEFWAKMNSGDIAHSEETSPASRFYKTEFYCDWLAKVGDYDASTGLKIAGSKSRYIYVPIHYPLSKAEAYDPQIRRLLETVKHDLAYALDVIDWIGDRGTRLAVQRFLLDRVSHAALVIGQDFRIIETNGRANDAISAGRPIAMRSGRLRIPDQKATKWLTDQISLALRTSKWSRTHSYFLDQGNVVGLTLTPIPELSDNPLSRGFSNRTMFVLEVADNTDRAISREKLTAVASLFDLTPAEVTFCGLLVSGFSVADIARKLGITESTARQRLKTIFAKTGKHSQAQLVLLLQQAAGS